MKKSLSFSHTGDALRAFLKKQIKARKMTYKELAKKLDVAEVTVKRWMTSRDINFEVFVAISKALGVNPVTLVEAGLSQEAAGHSYTREQEEYFVSHPKQFVLFIKLVYGCPANEAREAAQLTRPSFLRSMREMETLGLLKLYPNDRVKALVRGPFNASAEGPIMKDFIPLQYDSLYRHFKSFSQYQERPNPESPAFYRPFEMYLDRQTANEFAAELSSILLKYRSISHTMYGRWKDLKPISGVVSVDQYDSWAEVLCKD